MEKNWIIKEAGDNVVVRQLMKSLDVPESLANLMVQRGISSFEEARAFFRPSLENLHDPFLMKDMNIAVDRISSAIYKNEKILIYGDYDVDGTTSVALMYSFLRNIYPNIDFYSGIVLRAIGIPINMFTVMFAIGRLPGWISQWKESMDDPNWRIARPRQIYTGHQERDYIPIEQRG